MTARADIIESEHDALGIDLDRLHVLCIVRPDALPERRMRALIARELAELQMRLRVHFRNEERRGVYANDSDDAAALMQQHAEILQALGGLRERATTGRLAELFEDISDLLDTIGEHERYENAIVAVPSGSEGA